MLLPLLSSDPGGVPWGGCIGQRVIPASPRRAVLRARHVADVASQFVGAAEQQSKSTFDAPSKTHGTTSGVRHSLVCIPNNPTARVVGKHRPRLAGRICDPSHFESLLCSPYSDYVVTSPGVNKRRHKFCLAVWPWHHRRSGLMACHLGVPSSATVTCATRTRGCLAWRLH